ncbi:MAG: NAD kinase [Candidatus Nanopelagicales bacterium]
MLARGSILMVTHDASDSAIEVASSLIDSWTVEGWNIYAVADDANRIEKLNKKIQTIAKDELSLIDLVVVTGGDGTILRAVETARGNSSPILGINLGHVGFLAEAEQSDLVDVIKSVNDKNWEVENRLCLKVEVRANDRIIYETFALNDVSIEKTIRGHMFDLILAIDELPVSEFGADGIVCATPTGSTAYAFSAGGPVVWPEVEAILVVPISAHALFARPLVVSPKSKITVAIPGNSTNGMLVADGRREFPLPIGSTVEITRSDIGVPIARLNDTSFTNRLVAKFQLPVSGWRARKNST